MTSAEIMQAGRAEGAASAPPCPPCWREVVAQAFDGVIPDSPGLELLLDRLAQRDTAARDATR
ncbi:MAG: hypothetical protein ACLFRU_00395 [Paracoccaceae bacterium]